MLGAIWSLYKATERLRELHSDMTVVQVQTLLLVAWKPQITQVEIYRHLNVADSTVSRNIALLSDIGSRSRDGLGLINLVSSPYDRREKYLVLTPKGKRLIQDIMKDLKIDDSTPEGSE